MMGRDVTDVLLANDISLSGSSGNAISLTTANDLEPRNADICTGSSSKIRAYVEAGVAPATRRAYRSDLSHFNSWGGGIPSSEGEVAAYLAEHAKVLAVATLQRRLAAISVAHETRGLSNPVTTP